MQNDLKYGKLSEMCGINGYFAGNNRKNSHIIFKGGGEKISTFSKNILPWKKEKKIFGSSPPLR